MADGVVSGRFYRCRFSKDWFTSQAGHEVVFVLISQVNKSVQEALVAGTVKKTLSGYAPDLDRVYVVPWDRLDDFDQPVKKGQLGKARKDLEKKLKNAK
ncbi:hypothetical protein [Amycolatopsis sp. NPDC004169]|uniref:hypothetical protein n=1 Tax=Amycolatopsis sp. NPDC004169 TaxID=3154453 RepID=UPI0033BEA478